LFVLGYIPNDGYTEKGYIAEAKGLHPALRFEFRPVLQSERATYIQAIDELKPPQLKQAEAALVARHVTTWNLGDAKGAPVAVSEAMLSRLKPKLFNRLFQIVMGEEAGDEDPQAAPVEGRGLDLLEAIRQGTTPGLVRQEADAKNSSPG
jgi:hypothetical protein